MYQNTVTNNLKGKSIAVKPPKLPNVSVGTTSTNGVVNSRSIKPASPVGIGGVAAGPGVPNLLPPTPVATAINRGMRHTALSADGKTKVSAVKHLPQMTGPNPMLGQ